MIFLTKKRNKQFSYKPYFFKPIEENPYKIKQKFDPYRTTLDNNNLKQKIKQAFSEAQKNSYVGFNKIILINLIVLTLVFLLFIEFDFSIFV